MVCGESSFPCYHGEVMRTWLKNVAVEKVENEKKLTKVKAQGLETHCDGNRMYVCVFVCLCPCLGTPFVFSLAWYSCAQTHFWRDLNRNLTGVQSLLMKNYIYVLRGKKKTMHNWNVT